MAADKITQYLEILLDMHKTLYIQETTLTKLKQEYSSLGRKKRFSLPKKVKSKGDYAEGMLITGIVTGIIVGLIFVINFFNDTFKNGGIATIIFSPIVFVFAALIGAVALGPTLGLIVGKIIHTKNQGELDREYRQEMQEYNKLVEDDKMRLRVEEVQRNFLYEQIASLQAQIKKSRDNLSYFYSKNVIDKIYYNDMVAIASFYQYFKTKQTYSLGFDRSTGDTGAYRIYEYEKRMNIIITKLDTVIEKLDEIKNNQAVLYSTMIDANNKIDRMNKNVLLASQNMHDDIRNQTELMAYNNERVRKELEYRNTMDSIFTWK
nr:hypothetical protein [uncultured Ruminococcus sp.]